MSPTYALAHSGNAVTFAWHGHQEDTVLEWSIGGSGPCFLKDGQEVSRVTRDLSVSVLPRGTVSNFKIRAKVLTQLGTVITRQTELRVIRIIAEPVLSFDQGAPVNPCGLFVGGSATFQITFSSNVRAEDVQWSVANGKAALAFGPQSTAPQIVVGLAPGTETLTAEITHFVGSSPQFTFEVYPEANPIPIHFMFICDNDGNHAGSPSDIPGLVTGANQIWNQAGMSFSRATVSYVTNSVWYSNSVVKVTQQEILNAMSGTGGLEVYFVPKITFRENVPAANWTNGMLVTSGISSRTFAHGLGHCCGLPDIYDVHPLASHRIR